MQTIFINVCYWIYCYRSHSILELRSGSSPPPPQGYQCFCDTLCCDSVHPVECWCREKKTIICENTWTLNVTKTDIKSKSCWKTELDRFLVSWISVTSEHKVGTCGTSLCFIWGYRPLMALQSIIGTFLFLSLSHYSSPSLFSCFYSHLAKSNSYPHPTITLIYPSNGLQLLSLALLLPLSLLHSSACTFHCLSLIIGSVSRSLADFPTGATFKRALDTSLQPASGF